MGWAGATGNLSADAFILAGVLFAWQVSVFTQGQQAQDWLTFPLMRFILWLFSILVPALQRFELEVAG